MVSTNTAAISGPRRAAVGFILTLLAVPSFIAACDSGNPDVQTPVSELERGKTVFARYCNVCHPGGRAGSGPNLISVTPRLTDEQIAQLVRHGKNRMPGYKEADISDADLAGIIVYLRS